MIMIPGIARPLGLALALTALGFGGFACTEVKDTIEGADQALSGALNDEDAPELQGLEGGELTEALYQLGLQRQSEGRDAEAFERFRQAAERGHGPAAYELGETYNAGRGVDKDLDAGAKWINAAAARGEPRAQYALGAAYYNGTGVDRDYARAVRYLDNAASQGHPDAQYLLGESYANGRGVSKNMAWAARWYGKAAEQGHPEGAFSYGVVQAAGLGLPTNLARGYAWLDIAGELGHVKAGEVRAAIANKMTSAQIEAGRRRVAAFAPKASGDFADTPTVMYVQHSLNQLGFNAGPVDGLVGPRTRSAVSAYLSSLGEDATNTDITPALLRRLFEAQQNAAA
jgi:TPR repeat protein